MAKGYRRVDRVAVGGTKVAASAAKDANRTGAGLRKLAADLAARHAATDAEEDALFGAGRGDDDPGDPRTRRERVAAALEAERAAQEAEQEEARARAARAVQAARGGSRGTASPRRAPR